MNRRDLIQWIGRRFGPFDRGALFRDAIAYALGRPNPRRAFARQFAVERPKDYLETDVLPAGVSDGRITQADFAGRGQGQFPTCSVLAVSIDRVSYHRLGNRHTYRFIDPVTGMPDNVTVTTALDPRASNGDLGTLEKAFISFQERLGRNWQYGEFLQWAIPALTGRSTVTTQQLVESEAQRALAEGRIVTAATFHNPAKGLAPNHAYRILGVRPGEVLAKNPWGYIDVRWLPADVFAYYVTEI